MAKAWKIAPGQGASNWDMCCDEGCIVIGWCRLKDYRDHHTKAEVLRALKKAYRNVQRRPGRTAAQMIWRFAYKLQRFDIVVANKGWDRVVGLGVITSEYLP